MTTDLDVVLAAVIAGGVTRAYKVNKVPDKPDMPYTVVTVTRDAPGNRDLTGAAGTWGRRATLQSFDVDVDGALAFDRLATDALDGKFLDGIDGLWTAQVGAAVVRDPANQGVVGVTTSLITTTSA